METKKGNIAAEPVILNPEDKYDPNNLTLYHTSLALIDKLFQDGILTKEDYQKSCEILTNKYGFPLDSIFSEIA